LRERFNYHLHQLLQTAIQLHNGIPQL